MVAPSGKVGLIIHIKLMIFNQVETVAFFRSFACVAATFCFALRASGRGAIILATLDHLLLAVA